MRLPRAALLCVVASSLGLAQSWSTFFSAYEDGLEAQHRGDHRLAIKAFNRAISLAPDPGNRVKTYGLNFLPTYYPYLRLAESCLVLGDRSGAEQALAQSLAHRVEPAGERDDLNARLRQLLPAQTSHPAPQIASPGLAPSVGVSNPAPSAEPTRGRLLPEGAATKSALSKPLPIPDGPPTLKEVHGKSTASPAMLALTPAPLEVPSKREPLLPIPTAANSNSTAATNHGRRTLLWGGAALLGALGVGELLRRKHARPELVEVDGRPCFGPYLIRHELGRGGCATAHLGVHRATGEEVAIKVPHPHLSQDAGFRERFRREASLGARLDHPRIVRILDPGPAEGDPWLAMAFIKGRTLEAHLAQASPLSVDEAVSIALDIAEAMAYAHGRSVVHRDLKPGNIMLNEDGATVMDFGVARILDAALTTSTLFIGTPIYSAPESVATPQVGPPADRYALGIMLFEMLMGHPPFEGPSPFLILDAHRSKPLPPLADGLPPRLVRLVERLCAKHPEERPEDGETLAILGELKTRMGSVNSFSPRHPGVPPA